MTETLDHSFVTHVRGLVVRFVDASSEETDTDIVLAFHRRMRDDPRLHPEVFKTDHPLEKHCLPVVLLFYQALERNRDRDREERFLRNARFLGQVFDGYELKYRLGRGAMGEVYFAEARQPGPLAARPEIEMDPPRQAVKVVSFDASSLPQFDGTRRVLRRGRALQEARKLGLIRNHNHVVQYFGAKEDVPSESVFIRTEYIDGLSLDSLISEDALSPGPLPPDEARGLILQACWGLEAMHEADVLHRDVKPSNLMLDAEERLKIVDLGLAGSAAPNGTGRLTADGEGPGGTPGYVAPEQVYGGTADARSDVFSLGWTLFDLVCRPSAAVWDPGRLFRNLPDRSDPAWLQVPPGLAEVIGRATARDPNDRFQTVAEFREALRRTGPDTALTESLRRFAEIRAGDDHVVNIWVGEDLARRSRLSPTPSPASPVGRSRRAIFRCSIAGGAIVLSAAVGGWLLTHPPGRGAVQGPGQNDPPPLRPNDSPASVRHRGQVDVQVERKNREGAVTLLRLNEAGALPLRKTDKFRIEGRVDPPAYLYIVWVDPGHDVTPIYPWDAKLGWGSRPAKEEPVGRVSLPPNADRRYTAPDAKAGVATMVLFARPTPLDVSDDELRELFGGLPDLPLPAGGEQAAVWFDDYVEVRDPDRPRTFGEVGSDDAFARWQGRLQKVVGDKATFQTAVSFARTGGK